MSRLQKKKTYWQDTPADIKTDKKPKSVKEGERYVAESEVESAVLIGTTNTIQKPMFDTQSINALRSDVPFVQQQPVIYGPLFSGEINTDTLQKINGQGCAITPKAYASGTYGSLGCPVRPGDFVFSFIPAVSAAEYIARRLLLPKFRNENGANALACNNIGGRICIFICGVSTFLYADLSMTSAGGVTSENIQNIVLVASWDSMIGGVDSDVNRVTSGPLTTNAAAGQGLFESIIGLIPTSPRVTPGNCVYFCPTINMGSLFYIGTTFATNMTCPCINILSPNGA